MGMKKPKKDYSPAVTMYYSGMSIQEVADFYGITRQAMWMIFKRRGVVFRNKIQGGVENRFYRGGKDKDRHCTHVVEKAIQRGIIERKTHCENCGSSETNKDGRSNVEAHHDDYNKPLEVRWLCRKCHFEWHKENKAVKRKFKNAHGN